MAEKYSYEIKFWRRLAGIIFAAAAVFLSCLGLRRILPLLISLFAVFWWFAVCYIPLYYASFSYAENNEYIKLKKGVFVSRQTVIFKKHLSAKIAIKPFPLGFMGLCVTVLLCEGAAFTLPLLKIAENTNIRAPQKQND